VTDDSLDAIQFLDTATGVPLSDDDTLVFNVKWATSTAPPVHYSEALRMEYGKLIAADAARAGEGADGCGSGRRRRRRRK